MLSRVADSLYWMSRNVERAENLARYMEVTFNLMLDLPVGSAEQWYPLVCTTGDDEKFKEKYGEANKESVVRFLTFDTEYENSIINCLRIARENAHSIRETISTDMWEQLNEFYYMVRDAAGDPRLLSSPQEFFREVRMSSMLFTGITDSTMSRDEGWHFSHLGRLIERADKTSRILDVKYYILLPSVQDVGTPMDDLQWSAVLRSVDGLEPYRRQYHGTNPRRVAEFLVLGRTFPRAILTCILWAEDSLYAISGTPRGTFGNKAEQRIGQLRAELAYTTIDQITNTGLHEFLDGLQNKLNDVGQGIFETFIASEPAEV